MVDKNNDKKFGLTSAAVKNRTTVFFVIFLIVFGGLYSYITLPKENFPEIAIPKIYIGTAYPGNSPIDIENLVTRKIEKEVNSISEVDNIRSTSLQDYSSIVVEFPPGTNVLKALIDVKDKVDKSKINLPNDLPKDPEVYEINFSEFPIVNLNLVGEYPLEQLNNWAEDLKDELEKIPEVSKINIRGVDDKEVKIHLNPYAMETRKVSFSDVEKAVANENITQSAGLIKEGETIRRAIRIDGEYIDPEQMKNIIIKHEKNKIVYLRDIAEVSYGYKEKSNYARVYDKNVVMVDVVKKSGENLLNAMEQIKTIVQEFKSNMPTDLSIISTNDQSTQTKQMLNDLQNNIISGVILVVIVLLFFLGSRNALFVGVAIPLSMLITFLILGFLGITINMMVLFSLIMALGMLVDNGIVVVENVYRLMEEGYPPLRATLAGVGEVAWPIIASTATTLAAFLPLAFWPGIMGDFMKYLPITLIITLSSSLFVALFINPVLIFVLMKLEKPQTSKVKRKAIKYFIIGTIIGTGLIFIGHSVLTAASPSNPLSYAKANSLKETLYIIGNLINLGVFIFILNVFVLIPSARFFKNSVSPIMEKYYSLFLGFALNGRKPKYFFLGTILLLFLSVALMNIFPPKVLFFPESSPKYVNVFVEFPIGTDIEKTNTFTKKIYKNMVKVLEPYQEVIESIVTNVGQGTSDPSDTSDIGNSEKPQKSRITINFVDYKLRNGINTTEILDVIREDIKGYAGVSVTAAQDLVGPPVGKPVSIELKGEDLKVLLEQADRMKHFIQSTGIGGIEDLKPDTPRGKPELVLHIDRDKARRFGLSTGMVTNEIRTSLFGKEISKFKDGDKDNKVQIRLQRKYGYNLETLLNKSITFRDPVTGKISQIPISAVASVSYSTTYGSIKRKDLDRVVTLQSNILSGYNPTQINNQIKLALVDFELPNGYSFKFGGEQEKQAEEMAFLSKALMIAVFLILLIIIAQFNSITSPMIIIATVVLSTIGVFLGILVTGDDFVIIMTMIGIISLAGIVVNNAIVLIDFIRLGEERMRNKYQIEKVPMQETINLIIRAGKTRLRPVLLTAITTVLGLIPLAIGINIDFIGFFTSLDADFFVGGDNVAFWGPMSWTIIYGLTVATFLTLIVVPVMYLLIIKLKRRIVRVKDIDLQKLMHPAGLAKLAKPTGLTKPTGPTGNNKKV